MNEKSPGYIARFRPSVQVTNNTYSLCAGARIVGGEQSLVVGYSANLQPQGLEDMQVPTARSEEGNHGNLYAQSDFLLTCHGTKPSHVLVVKRITASCFDYGILHEDGFLPLKFYRCQHLPILPSVIMDFSASDPVSLLQKLESPTLILANVRFALEVANNLPGTF